MELFDTGISWIGKVPSDWKILPLKCVSKVILGKMLQDKQKSQEETLERYICAKDVHLDGINWYEPKEMYFSPMEKNLLLVKNGDLLIVEGGAGAGGAFVADNPTKYDYYVQNSINIVRVNKKFAVPQYIYYWIFKLVTNKYVEVACNVATIPHFTKEKVSSVQIPLPSVDIQHRIVNYLDAKTAEIDNQISLLAKKRDAYMRLKKSIINRAVTQGLNPDVEMKESGIDWIGMMPKHWEIRLLKNMMTIHNGRDYKHIEVDDPEEGYPVIGSGGPFAFAKEKMYSGEALLLGRKGTIDKPLYWHGSFWTVDTMFYAKPSNLANCKYMYYLSLNFPFRKIGTQTALPSMTQTALNCLEVSCPPLTEQQTIADYLDERTAKIDAVVSNLDQQIEKYKLLKRALINEVVTGQRAV